MADQVYQFERNDGQGPIEVIVSDGVTREQARQRLLERDPNLRRILADTSQQREERGGFNLQMLRENPRQAINELGGAVFGALQGVESLERYAGRNAGTATLPIDMAGMAAGPVRNITRPTGTPPEAGVSTPAAGAIRGPLAGASEELGAFLQEGVARPAYQAATGGGQENVQANIDEAYRLQAEQLEEERRTRGGQQAAAELTGGAALVGPAIGTGGTLAGMALRGGVSGAGLGTASGFFGTENQGLDARLRNAGLGGLVGAPLGALAGAAIPLAQRAVAPRASRAARRVAEALGIDLGDVQRIADSATDDPRLVGERLGAPGRDAMVGVSGLSQEAQEIGARGMARRIPEFRREVVDAFTQPSGTSGQGARGVIRSSREAQQATGEVFEGLRPVQIESTPQLRASVRTIARRDPDAISFVDGGGAGPTPLRIYVDDADNAGALTIGQLQDLAREAEDAASAAFSAGRGGRGAELAQAAREIRNQIKAQSPEFAQASQLYSSEFRVQQAADLGRKAFSGARSVQDDIAELGDLAQLNAGERAAFMEGLMEAVEGMAGRADELAGDPSRPFRSGNVRDVIRRIYGDQADAILGRLDEIGEQYGTLALANRSVNSATAARQSAENRVEGLRGQSVIADVIESPQSAITMARQRQNLAERLRRGDTELNARTAAELLFAPSGDGVAARQFMQQVNERRAAQGLAPLPAQAAMALFLQRSAEGRPMGPLGPAAPVSQ